MYKMSDANSSVWISKYGWTEHLDGYVFITNQDENIKTKNITEKISFDSKLYFFCYTGRFENLNDSKLIITFFIPGVAAIMASGR